MTTENYIRRYLENCEFSPLEIECELSAWKAGLPSFRPETEEALHLYKDDYGFFCACELERWQ